MKPDMDCNQANGHGGRLDAGCRDIDHYASRLPRWRYKLRQALIPIIRAETPYLAMLQHHLRSPNLDGFFAWSANLGTHTAFMVLLPIFFWAGHTSFGRAYTQMLAAGVFFSGAIKDLLCLPRPLSPPLRRISMSGSAALEYGFPSTHSTNAVSVAAYALVLIWRAAEEGRISSHASTGIQLLIWGYTFAIVFGRLILGMHGFFDVIVGSLLGLVIAIVQIQWGEDFEVWLTGPSPIPIITCLLLILFCVRIHPEPADDCPCFDDGVAFAGVIIGIEGGIWHFATTSYSVSEPTPGTAPFSFERVGIFKSLLRVVLGIALIFAWRATMKPILLGGLPPLFRTLERVGFEMPRRYFLKASQYTKIPSTAYLDSVIPSASDLPTIITSFRHPRRRAVSIGPQSQADAYEAIAYRRIRRESMGQSRTTPSPMHAASAHPFGRPKFDSVHEQEARDASADDSPDVGRERSRSFGETIRPEIEKYQGMMGSVAPEQETEELGEQEEEAADQNILAGVQKPRVRYDVEVVTKLIVYSGIAWLAVEGGPILFEILGLGMS
ncbi:PAP2-domain-containing protein [Eremomyces bilateralis CBS 781.70]|uniref:PAP2-domain-containing protein n=1 Tax=Eremomyces bilateralis CBS 781.70 TaxID=1392243 RepID=A0A6G1FX99_9PEZI|nr:PAP2-domain-containing protein [Eremomyces bilateralis CBS 781.70]KAF1810404.1 PAP2-domain-containing protein [Eremomyces bilateralis CBS 781.70]